MTLTFPKLEPWQQPVFDYMTKETQGRRAVVKSKRQVGKSCLAEIILIWYALRPKSVSCLVEPTLGQSRRVYTHITNMLEGSGIIRSANAQLLEIVLTNGAMIVFRSGEQLDSLRGMTIKDGILILDEGAFLQDTVYQILYPTLDAHNANLLVLSTPLFADGEFYRLCHDKEVKLFDWAEYDTSKYLPEERLEYYRQRLPDMRFRSEYLAQFITDGGYVFKSFTLSNSTQLPDICAIDWGLGTSGDYTWLTWMDKDGDTTRVWYDNTLSPSSMIDEVASLILHSGVKTVIVEENSIGKVYLDLLEKRITGLTMIKFHTDNESKRMIIENLAKALEQGKCKIADDKELKTQLQNYGVQKTKTGYTYNATGSHHDDGVMSLAMAYYGLSHTATYAMSVPHRRKKKIPPSERYR